LNRTAASLRHFGAFVRARDAKTERNAAFTPRADGFPTEELQAPFALCACECACRVRTKHANAGHQPSRSIVPA
jgi:hypothetical protein